MGIAAEGARSPGRASALSGQHTRSFGVRIFTITSAWRFFSVEREGVVLEGCAPGHELVERTFPWML